MSVHFSFCLTYFVPKFFQEFCYFTTNKTEYLFLALIAQVLQGAFVTVCFKAFYDQYDEIWALCRLT